jgi:hypothetical protein
MRRFHIYIGFIVWLLTSLFAVSCTDELEGNGYTPNSSSNLHVLVPTVLSANGTRTDDASGLPTYNATVDECQINDLRLYAFPVNNEGKLIAENLPAPLASMMLNEKAAEYQLTITPGTYHIYVVANMSDVLSNQPIENEDDLKKVTLNYGVGTKPGMPVCTNIPMIYEPEKDATTGKLVETKITPTGNKYTEVIANMKFTCVKVKLNLIFDPTQADVKDNFGGKSILIDSIVANKLSPFTNLYWGGKFVEESLADDEYKTGFSSKQYTSGSDAPAVYYTDWEDHTLEAEANNKNDIVGKGNPTPAPIDAAKKWLFQSTYYLPERYISSAADRSYLTINGKVANSASNDYRIDLGHKKDETSSSEVPTFPRGTYYEITGKIKSLGNMTLDCNVSIKPWETVKIDADFNHTTLWVSKTEAYVTSSTNDYITYNSNAAIVESGCDNQIGSKDIIISSKRGKDSIEFRINPNIPISDYAKDQREGTAKVWLKANNLKKYIDVHYDVTPYLDVTKELVIYYNSKDPEQNKRTIKWDTNLGGIVLDRITDTNTITDTKGKSTIKMSLASSAAATGTFMVTATKDPVTTTIHEFKVTSKDGSMSQTVRVTVSPPIGDYRIYFRAINDRSKYTGGNRSDNFKGILAEEGTNNWSDGWNKDANDTSVPQRDNHRIYVYTQIGETEDEVTGKGWIFTEGPANKNGWPGEEMEADETNTGWYYKDFPQNAQSVLNTNNSEGSRTITPGETLIMFSNNTYVDQGYSLHRCPHHLEPGIPLFDYEDREGWIVYDPTSDPIWHVYDDMPEIEDIEIKVYTQEQTWGWYKHYGIADGSNQFKINDPSESGSDKGNSWTCKKVENGWWKTVIKLKAIKGEHNKDIRIHLKDTKILLFDGNSYEKYGDTGYYQNGNWYQGKPNGVTE